MKKILFILLLLPCMVQGQNFRHLFSGYFGSNNTTSGNPVYVVKAPLSSAQILNISTTPVEIIPAPGAGKFIKVLSIEWYYTFLTSAYSSTQLQLKNGSTVITIIPGTTINSAVSGNFDIVPLSSSGLALQTNTAVNLTAASNPTGGVGSAYCIVSYLIITTP